MARGTTRAPSQNAYRGSLGRTQTTTAHVTGSNGDTTPSQIYSTVDAVSDPELAEQLRAGTLNDGIPVPVLYHDPAAELMVLVLGDVHRHRELDERIAVLARMRDESTPIPAYAKDFTVVYGGAALGEYLERKADEALAAPRRAELETELAESAKELERITRERDERARELAARTHELDEANAEVERAHGELEKLRREMRARVLASAQEARPPTNPGAAVDAALDAATDAQSSEVDVDAADVLETTSVGPAPTPAPSKEPVLPPDDEDELEEDSFSEPVDVSVALVPYPLPKGAKAKAKRAAHAAPTGVDSEAFETVPTRDVEADALGVNGHAAAPAAAFDDETTGATIVPQGSDPLTTQTAERPVDVVTDPWLDKAAARDTSSVIAEPKGPVRLALIASEQLARGLGGNLDLRVLLQRTPSYPVITLVIGPPPALRVPSPSQLAVIPLDLAADAHRAVLTALGRQFELTVDVLVRGRRIRRVVLSAPLAENVGYILRAADDHLRAVTAGGAASFERGRDLVLAPGYDVLGTTHADNSEFRDDKLAQLSTAQHLRRAIAMARRFARPAREDYLVCTRGFPLPRWRELRRHVVESAVALGLWMGPELAQVAVSEGLARSRRDLIVRLDAGFEKLKVNPTAFDIDAEAADDNANAIAEEARALGVELKSANGTNGHGRPAAPALTSEDLQQVSGSIGGTPPSGVPRQKATDELIAELDDRQKRVAAALELCDRGEARAAVPVIAAVTKMSRAEAVRVLGMSVKFGDAAAKPLIDGLASSKGFLRHGCALALALLRTEDGTQAVIDLLLAEPTEIWREVARAIGQVGPPGLLPLAANFGRLGDRATPQLAERVAWAMAHIAVRGGKPAVETMAHGQSVVAPVARQALQLHASAANDQVRVRPGQSGSQAGKDITVNRAFSRRFFEALEQGLPEASQAGLEALDASSPMELLDESDLVEDDDEAELDESDLIQ